MLSEIYATGIGGQTALKLIRQHGSIESILENINKERWLSKFLRSSSFIVACIPCIWNGSEWSIRLNMWIFLFKIQGI